jgi:basic membrane protein A
MSNWKKLAIFGVSALTLAACGNGGTEEEPDTGTDTGEGTEEPADGAAGSDFSIAMITDTGGVDDRSFNQSAWEGMQAWAEDNGFGEDTIRYYQSDAEDQYIPNLQTATTDGFDVIYGVGFLLQDPITTIAEQNPDRWYGIVDSVVEADNVVSLTFADHENSYLAGVAAALTTETDQIGFIGGIEGEVIDRFQTGFEHGVESVNPDIEVDVQYANSFDDAGAGQQIASAMYQSGVDVIFHAAGAVGNGVFQEARNRMEAGTDTDLWVIGVDRDQSEEGNYDGGNLTLGSTIKNVGSAVAQSANAAMEGNFPGGETIAFGLAENGIDFVTHEDMPQETLDAIEEARQGIVDGEIEVREFTYSQ